jgi:hypothetical protein
MVLMFSVASLPGPLVLYFAFFIGTNFKVKTQDISSEAKLFVSAADLSTSVTLNESASFSVEMDSASTFFNPP